MNNQKNYTRGVIFALINCFSLGILGVVDKVGTIQSSNPIIFSTQSLLFSVLFTIIFILVYSKGLPVQSIEKISPSAWKLILLVGIFSSSLFMLFRFLGLTQSTGTFATLSQIITTSLTALLAWIFLKEKLSKVFWIIFAIIIFSVYFVSVGKITLASVQTGDMFIIIGTFFLAGGNIFSRLAVQKVDPVLVSGLRLFFGLIFLLLIDLFLLNGLNGLGGIFNHLTIWAILSGFLVSTGVLGFNLAIKRLGVTFGTSMLMMAPVITMVLEYLFLDYHFTLTQVVAALVVVISGIALILANNKPLKSSTTINIRPWG